jgi:hypothetical protein
MDPVQTLHDFTLNLLGDPTALASFGQDPQAALAAAGLGDISAADVHEVMPLVLDYVPVDNLTALGQLPQAGDLTGVLADGPQGAIEQLQALTASFGLPAVDTASLPALPALPELPAVGSLPVVGDLPLGAVPALPALPTLPGATLPAVPALPALPGVSALPGLGEVQNAVAGVTALAQGPASSFAFGNDLSNGLDSDAVAKAGGIASGAASQVQHLGGDVVGAVEHASPVDLAGLTSQVPDVAGLTSQLPDVAGLTSHLPDVAGLTSQVPDISGLTSQLPDVSGATAPVGDLAGHLTEAGGGVAGHVSDLAGHLTEPVGHLTGALSPAGLEHAAGSLVNGAQSAVHTPDLGARADTGTDAVHSGTDAVHSGTDAGVGAVHDTVSTVTAPLHDALGGLGLHAGVESQHGGGDLHISL